MKIDFKKLAVSPGYVSLRKDVMRDIADSYRSEMFYRRDHQPRPCFNPVSCSKKECDQRHRERCMEFRWVIDRAKHYSHYLDVPVETIIEKWENNRNYWYVNYYQDSNFPKLTRYDVKVFETTAELKHYIETHKYRCSRCGGITTNPLACNSGVMVGPGKKCNWLTYGLFRADGIFVVDKEECHPVLIFKPIEENQSEAPQ